MNDPLEPTPKFAAGGLLPPGLTIARNDTSAATFRVLTQAKHDAIASIAKQYADAHRKAMTGIQAGFNQLAEFFQAIAPLYATQLIEQNERRRRQWTETRRRTRTRTRSRR